jgi:hypothetical protein
MIEFAIAFLNSFRTYNPAIPLCLVPFDEETKQVQALQGDYGFDLWQDANALRRCDEISLRFHPEGSGQYRKLAVWDGPYDEFLYIDCDTVVLGDVNYVFRFLDRAAFVTSVSNLPAIRKWVWKDSIYATRTLTHDQIDFAANTGFIASTRGKLSLDRIEEKVPAATILAPHMELLCAEQPLLNYLMVTSGQPYTSLLFQLRRSGDLEIPLEHWGGAPVGPVRDGRIIAPLYPRILVVHWAGEWRKLQEGCLPNLDLWSFYRHRGVLRTPMRGSTSESVSGADDGGHGG